MTYLCNAAMLLMYLFVSYQHGIIQYAVPPLMVLQDIISATGGSVLAFYYMLNIMT